MFNNEWGDSGVTDRYRVMDNPEEVAHTAARVFASRVEQSVLDKGWISVALSGGTTPRGMFRNLAREPYQSSVPWHYVHIFWVDERCVPYTDSASNFGTAKADFLDFVYPNDRALHPMPVDMPPITAAHAYEEELRSFFQMKRRGFPSFDCIFLGVGADGHTASLFPGDKALEEETRWVLPVHGGDPPVDRLTLTLPVINHAKQVICLATGMEKSRHVLSAWRHSETDAPVPVAQVAPSPGDLLWIVDRDAVAGIPEDERNSSFQQNEVAHE